MPRPASLGSVFRRRSPQGMEKATGWSLDYRCWARAFVLRLLLAAGPAPGFPGLCYVTSGPEAKAESV